RCLTALSALSGAVTPASATGTASTSARMNTRTAGPSARERKGRMAKLSLAEGPAACRFRVIPPAVPSVEGSENLRRDDGSTQPFIVLEVPRDRVRRGQRTLRRSAAGRRARRGSAPGRGVGPAAPPAAARGAAG